MRWTHIRGQLSLIPVTRTSKRGCSCCAVVVPTLGPPSLPTCILTHTTPQVLGLRRPSGTLPRGSHLRGPRRVPMVRQLMAGGAGLTRLTRLTRSRPTRSTSREATRTQGRGPHHTRVRCNGSPALGRSSRCARNSKLLRPRPRHLLRSLRSSHPMRTLEALIPERSVPSSVDDLLALTLRCKARRRRRRRRLPNRCT